MFDLLAIIYKKRKQYIFLLYGSCNIYELLKRTLTGSRGQAAGRQWCDISE
jgi:hypothetical protein